jgi:hypothetical protein
VVGVSNSKLWSWVLGTRNQKWLSWRGPAAMINYRPGLSSEIASHIKICNCLSVCLTLKFEVQFTTKNSNTNICTSLRITRFVGCVNCQEFWMLESATLRKLDLLSSSGKGRKMYLLCWDPQKGITSVTGAVSPLAQGFWALHTVIRTV